MPKYKKSDSRIWQRQEFRMKPDHTWTAPPGHKIFVADRGAVQFNFPAEWVVIPTSDAIELHDRRPPDDDCLLKVSVMYAAEGIDWGELTVPYLLKQTTKDDERGNNLPEPDHLCAARRGGIRLVREAVHRPGGAA